MVPLSTPGALEDQVASPAVGRWKQVLEEQVSNPGWPTTVKARASIRRGIQATAPAPIFLDSTVFPLGPEPAQAHAPGPGLEETSNGGGPGIRRPRHDRFRGRMASGSGDREQQEDRDRHKPRFRTSRPARACVPGLSPALGLPARPCPGSRRQGGLGQEVCPRSGLLCNPGIKQDMRDRTNHGFADERGSRQHGEEGHRAPDLQGPGRMRSTPTTAFSVASSRPQS